MGFEERLQLVQSRIEAACQRAGRSPGDVLLMGVTKNHPPDMVKEAFQNNLTRFGESKVQEAKAKILLCPGGCRWEMIGHLQSNKVKDAVRLFERIQSVDSLDLAEEIHKQSQKAAKTMPILLEVNVAGESSKFGYAPDRLLSEIEQINAFKHLEIQGLMAVPPWTDKPEKARGHFQKLRELKGKCEEILGAPLPHLSMGMSGDFEVAVEEGATIIRLGTILFGERKYPVRKLPSED
jgi:hypothetical protein